MIQTKTAPFTLPALPYEQNALEPGISARAIGFHYGKHHQAYVNKLNELAAGSEFADLTLEEIIAKTSGDGFQAALFNNAAQAWNHTFYWNSLSPDGGGKPSGELGRKIEISFGSYENFIREFGQAGMDQFGSGWVWLVQEGNDLKITKTSNAGNPLSQGRGTALLALDVWEHAYYLDYQNRRNDYLTTILDKLINWNFAAENSSRA
ncbi:MAG TPA: superoxide dismutase [bacterium]|nr:superoxide dismutase [bacterium]